MNNQSISVSGKRIKIIFEDDMKEWLFKESKKRNTTVSQLVRDAIKAEMIKTA